MTREHKLTQPPTILHDIEPASTAVLERAEAQVGQSRRCNATQSAGECRLDVSMQKRTENFNAAGQDYRFERLALPMVLRDLRFSKDDPGPGDAVPEFDLPTVDGGRFRSSDLPETGPVLLIFGTLERAS